MPDVVNTQLHRDAQNLARHACWKKEQCIFKIKRKLTSLSDSKFAGRNASRALETTYSSSSRFGAPSPTAGAAAIIKSPVDRGIWHILSISLSFHPSHQSATRSRAR